MGETLLGGKPDFNAIAAEGYQKNGLNRYPLGKEGVVSIRDGDASAGEVLDLATTNLRGCWFALGRILETHAMPIQVGRRILVGALGAAWTFCRYWRTILPKPAPPTLKSKLNCF